MNQTFVNINAFPPAAIPKPIATAKQKSPRKTPTTDPSNCPIAVKIPTVPPSESSPKIKKKIRFVSLRNAHQSIQSFAQS